MQGKKGHWKVNENEPEDRKERKSGLLKESRISRSMVRDNDV